MIKSNTNKVLGGMGMALMASLLVACNSPMGSSSNAGGRSLIGYEAPTLGVAASFAVFGGGAGVTNQGTGTTIIGDMGTTGASTMLTGFHSSVFSYDETPLNVGAVTGNVYTDAPEGSMESFEYAKAAAADILVAFNDLASCPDGMDPGAGQLGGLTLLPGVYKSASGAFLVTGSDLTLDAQGDSDAIWIFQMASTLTVGVPTAPTSVILVNGAQAKNVFWQVGSAATINGAGGGHMAGTIIASSGITFSTAGNATATILDGQALSLFASITMVNTVVNASGIAYEVPVVEPTEPIVEPIVPSIVVSGSAAALVVAVPGNGFINVENNGGIVSATETGIGTIAIINNGGTLTATNTGNGLMTINSTATGTVTVTNTGNGRVFVTATGVEAITVTHTGDEDFYYPNL